jgi:hypothetical protein
MSTHLDGNVNLNATVVIDLARARCGRDPSPSDWHCEAMLARVSRSTSMSGAHVQVHVNVDVKAVTA